MENDSSRNRRSAIEPSPSKASRTKAGRRGPRSDTDSSAPDHLWDFRDVDPSNVVAAPNDFRVFAPLERSIELVDEGQFAVGHLDYSADAVSVLDPLTHLFCIRNMRDVLSRT